MNFNDYLTIQPLVDFFHAHPYSSGIITYLIVFFETLAFVGMVIPGAIIMPIIGFLIGSHVIPFGSTFLWAIAGAITGDYMSYFVGIYFQDRVHSIWPFSKWPKILEQGEKFFRAHGGKSVFIGRFVVVVRTVTALIAGMLRMSFIRFTFVGIPAAVIWAVIYIIPGVLLGALSLELPPRFAAEFTLWSFLVIIVVWLVMWFVHHFFRQTLRLIDYYITRMWEYCKNHKTLKWITESLADPRQLDNHQQLTLAIAAFIAFALYFFAIYQVVTDGFLTGLDYPVYHLLRGLRTHSLDYIAVVATSFGDITMLTIASGMLLIWFLWRRYWHVASHWFMVLALCALSIGGTKISMYLPRPAYEKTASSFDTIHALFNVILEKYLSSFTIIQRALSLAFEKHTSSFPSAHTAISLAFYGFLAVIIAREMKKQKRWIPYVVSGVLIFLVAFSRLYLGMHWLTDVLGGVFIGSAIILVATISYRRHQHFHFSARKISMVVISIFAAVWLGCVTVKFHKQVKEYSLVWPTQTVSLDKIQTVAPLYRMNRFGHPIEAFNLEWVGNIKTIEKSLVGQGWKVRSSRIDPLNIVRGYFDSAAIYHLPILPQLYQNKPPVLLLTKKTSKDGVVLVLHLWSSNITLSDVKKPLWIGAVKYYSHYNKGLSLESFRQKHNFVGATKTLTTYLNDFGWKEIVYSKTRQPLEMSGLHWNGKSLVIQSK
jgi:membrane protein DedA with SNARE-associated domain/membrane-associated phospholipid phosphatase